MTDIFYLDETYREQVQSDQLTLKIETVAGSNFKALDYKTLGWVILAIIIVFFVTGLIEREYDYRTNGIDISATITDCDMVLWGRSDLVPEISYYYVVAGITYADKHFVPRHTTDCDDFPSGMRLTARYLAHNVAKSTIVDDFANRVWWEALGTSCVLGWATWFALRTLWGSINGVYLNLTAKVRYPRLLKDSILLNGEIVEATSFLVRRSQSYHVHILYRFTTLDGRTLQRKQSKVRFDLANQPLPEPGTPVKVLYADDHAVVML